MTAPQAALAACLVLVAFVGCLDQGPVPTYTIAVSTAYDPEMTPEDDRARARQMSFEEGDPADRDDPNVEESPYAVVSLVGHAQRSRDSGSNGDISTATSYALCAPVQRGAILDEDTDGKTGGNCVPLNGTGSTWFRVETTADLTLDQYYVLGMLDDDDECEYRGNTDDPALNPDRVIDRNLSVTVPFGIECG